MIYELNNIYIISAVVSFVIAMAAISIVDYLTHSIYDWMIIAGSVVGFVLLIIGGVSPLKIIYGAVTGFVFYILIFMISYKAYGKEAFGMGDVLLNIYICGFLTGPLPAIVQSFLTFFVAAAIVLVVSLIKRKVGRQIPLAPSMAISSLLVLFLYQQILDFALPYL